MKTTFTILTSVFIYTHIFAQIAPSQIISGTKQASIDDNIIMSGNEALNLLMTNPNPTTSSQKLSTAFGEVQIGLTTYDLQTNASVMDRIIYHADGTISAAWTMSHAWQDTYTDRGTGYNFYNGNTWDFMPTARLETSRCGWPTLLATSSGKEISMAHNTENSYLQMTHRSAIGTGGWQEQIISTIDTATGLNRYLIWNRTAVGGNGETLHMVAVTEPSGGNFSGTLYNGLNGALLYYRSQDGGTTWDIQDKQLPTLDTSMFVGFGGDAYAIQAQGNTVVLAHFGGWEDSFIMKSTDNGETWTKTIFLDFPVDRYNTDDGVDLDGDGAMDSIFSTDGSGTLLLDNNGDAHVFAGNMRLLDADLSDGSTSYFPGTNGLLYWNESMGADTGGQINNSIWESLNMDVITGADDLDGDSVLSLDNIPIYFLSLSSMPSAGIDASGVIYLSYSAIVETSSNGTQNFRHIYIIKSEDGGTNWSEPIDVTPHPVWDGNEECVYASMDHDVDGIIRIVYQKDGEPGLVVKDDNPVTAIDENEIMYLELDAANLTTAIDNIVRNNTQLSVYPNPAKDFTTLQITATETEKVNISIVDVLGKVVYSDDRVIHSGMNVEHINIPSIQNGIYFINTQIGTQTSSNKLVIVEE